jgi:urease accessory protein
MNTTAPCAAGSKTGPTLRRPVRISKRMTWNAQLTLAYRRAGERSVVHDRHSGPLRILASLYPESAAVCHNVLVHPPGGLVGGDALRIDLALAAQSHALLTTPGATRFYRSAGEPASQTLSAHVASGARLEWLPQETLCRRGAIAENRMHFELAPGAEMIGWDVLGLGLPASGEDFDAGRVTQTLALNRVWLEHGVVDGGDRRLLDSPLGFAHNRVHGLLWCATGTPLPDDRREALLDAARQASAAHALRATLGSTSPHAQLVLLRALAPRVEPLMQLFGSVWAAWRLLAWGLPASAPRVWRT